MVSIDAVRVRMGMLTRVVLAVVLAVSLTPVAPYTAAAAVDGERDAPRSTADDGRAAAIADMVAAGSYVEGEAIAIVRADTAPYTPAEVEQIAEVGRDSIDLITDGVEQTATVVDDTAALRIQSAPTDSYDVKLVVDHARTTEQILCELYDDPDVIAAEPNYSYDAAEALEGLSASDARETLDASDALAATDVEGSSGQAATSKLVAASPDTLATQVKAAIDPYSLTDIGDLTDFQWAYGEGMSTVDAAGAPTVGEFGYTLNVPGWTAGRTNASAEPNASGTVCIMDTGLDPKHPDLQGVLYEFTPDQQRMYGCGPYGYNASGDSYPVYTMRPSGEHGMHVAGIVASAWNGQGTSGVAKGVKIFGVNVFGGTGSTMVMSSVIKGFQFLVKAAQDVNLKAVNCSWGIKQTSFALSTMINELGKQGVNTVIASGNDHENLDDRMELASQATNSPYVIRVNAAGSDGKPTMFSSYGQTATDVYAPGQGIISTLPVEVASVDGPFVSRSRCVRFFPAGSGADGLISRERFESAPKVRFFDANPALSADAKELAPTAESVGFGDARSVSFDVASLNNEKPRQTGERHYDMQGLVGENGYVYLAIPAGSADWAEAKWVSVALAMSNGFRPAGGVAALTYERAADGAAVEVDTSSASVLKTGWESSAATALYQVHWSTASFFSEAIIQAVDEAREHLEAGETYERETQIGTFTYRDPGKLSGLYGWESDGETYLIAKVALGASHETPPAGTKLYIDEVAVGASYAGSGAYGTMSGTSMASPAVAGCLAVIAKDEPESSTLTDAQLELEARERAAKLLASVDYDESLSKLCRTGGRVNLAANPGFAKKAPLITCAESDGSTLAVSGSFFGESGSVSVDGNPAASQAWADGQVTVSVPGLARGAHVVKVTNADGAIAQAVFTQPVGEGSAAALYEHNLTPPTSEPAFNAQDRMWGSLVACDGALYGIAASIKYQLAQGIWRYDIAKNAWSSVALPDGYLHSNVTMSNMAECDGSLYLYGQYTTDADDYVGESCLWRYDSAQNTWAKIDMVMPNGAALCTFKGKLFFLGGTYPEGLGDFGSVRFTILNLEKRQFAKVKEGAIPEDFSFGNQLCAVASRNHIYCYSWAEGDDFATVGTQEMPAYFQRLTFDEKTSTMSVEDLSAAFEEYAPSLAPSGEDMGHKAHLALAGLPDGVAVIGSKEKDADSFDLGHDTFVIYDDEKVPARLGRTSTYQRAFDPMAVYASGRLYALGYSPAEPHIAYFRATDLWDAGTVTSRPTCTASGERTFNCLYRTAHYVEAIPALGHSWDAGTVTRAAAPGVAGVRTFTCATCGETRTETIPALPGGAPGKSYVVAGSTYKVTSNAAGEGNGKGVVSLVKAKAVKSVSVPPTVCILGKIYRVSAIGAKALSRAKKKATTLVVGKNVTRIAKRAFFGCTKLAKVTVKTKKLNRAAVKGCLKGSSVKVVVVNVGTPKANKTYAKKYKSYFAKTNSGKKVTVRTK